MLERLKIMDARYQEINELLQDSEVVKDVKKLTVLMKEMRQLEKTVSVYHKYLELLQQVEEAKELLKEDSA
ncbi:MAG: PCRF domain-containing protein, partial [Bacilli bacterium]|nr:PCRF domain-containing protein [Bacilli bacterium]